MKALLVILALNLVIASGLGVAIAVIIITLFEAQPTSIIIGVGIGFFTTAIFEFCLMMVTILIVLTKVNPRDLGLH